MGLILINLDAISLPWSFQSTFSSISKIFIDLDKCNCFVRSLSSATCVSKIFYLVLKNAAPVLSTSKAIYLFASSQKESSTVPLFNFTWTCYDIPEIFIHLKVERQRPRPNLSGFIYLWNLRLKKKIAKKYFLSVDTD